MGARKVIKWGNRESHIKERTSKGSAGPFIKVRSKGTFEPQYENGIRGNAILDRVDPSGSNLNYSGGFNDPLIPLQFTPSYMNLKY